MRGMILRIHGLSVRIQQAAMCSCPTSAADAGKEVRIELRTNTDKYSGVVNEVYCAYSCDRVCDDI